MSQPAPHVIPYTPRPLQWRFHEERSRFCVLLCHRRFGKTVAAVNDLVRQALRVGRDDWRAAYAAPFLGQAKAVAWDYCKRFAGAVPGTRFLESELVCVLPTGGRIRLLGTENAQALRGLYLDDLVLDEPADMPRQVWTQVLRPMLADRQGRALFCGTPQGTDNLLYDVWQQAGADTQGLWSRFRFPASETGYLPQAELAAARRGMDEAEYARGSILPGLPPPTRPTPGPAPPPAPLRQTSHARSPAKFYGRRNFAHALCPVRPFPLPQQRSLHGKHVARAARRCGAAARNALSGRA